MPSHPRESAPQVHGPRGQYKNTGRQEKLRAPEIDDDTVYVLSLRRFPGIRVIIREAKASDPLKLWAYSIDRSWQRTDVVKFEHADRDVALYHAMRAAAHALESWLMLMGNDREDCGRPFGSYVARVMHGDCLVM